MDKQKVQTHAYSDQRQHHRQGHGTLRDLAGHPYAAFEFMYHSYVTENGTYIDNHPQCDKSYSRPHGQACGVYGKMRLVTLHLTQEQSEARNREPYAHQAQPGPYPRKKGSLGGEVDSWISFSLFWIRH
jgi:hypothetical protein